MPASSPLVPADSAANTSPGPAFRASAVFDVAWRCTAVDDRLTELFHTVESGGAVQAAERMVQSLDPLIRGQALLHPVGVAAADGDGAALTSIHGVRLLALHPLRTADGAVHAILADFGPAQRRLPGTGSLTETGAMLHMPGLDDSNATVQALERLLNKLPHPVLVKDRAHRWLLLNDSMCALIGHPREKLLGRTDHDFLPAEQADGYWANDDRVFATGEDHEAEEVLTDANGGDRVILTRKRLAMLPGPHGQEVHVVIATVIDLTEIRHAECALRESEEHHRYSVELNPQVPWTADARGMIDHAASRWTELTGMAVEDAVSGRWLTQLHPDDQGGTAMAWAAAVRSGRPFDHEYRVRLFDGHYHWFRARAAARRDENGNIVRWYGTLEDIEDRKQASLRLRESEAFSRGVLESSPSCIRVLDHDGVVLYVNTPGYRLLERDADFRFEGRNWLEYLPVADRPAAEAAMATAREGGTGTLMIQRRRRDGTVQWLDTTVTAIRDGDRRTQRLLAVSTDVTEQKLLRDAAEQAQREMAQMAQRLSDVLESTMDSVIVVDRQWRLTYWNGNAARALQGRHPRAGHSLWDVVSEDVDGTLGRSLHRAMTQQAPVACEEYLCGVDIWVEVHAYPNTSGLSIFFRDITERRRAEQERLQAQERISYMARHDALTGLPNRVVLREQLERAVREARHGVQAAVLCLDLDGFKAVNDTFGHPIGDALLRQVAERLRSSIRAADTVSRFGGDEFAVVQAGVADVADAAALAGRIIAALSEPFAVEEQKLQIGACVGIAMVPGDGSEPDDFLRAADIALYRAKEDGHSHFRFFHAAMDEHLRARLDMKRALHGALARGELTVQYQPVYRLRSGTVACFEALLRWRHPERGMISPAEFVPLAEEAGLMSAIGEWVLMQACSEATRWPTTVSVAVNLSPTQFRNAQLVQGVERILKETGLSPSRLQLEITESVMLQENSDNLSILQQLRGLGVQIAMDDFGTGYSSLSYLRSFPFDKIKLDRSFIKDLHEGGEARAILHAVAGLGSGFNIVTTAEGVETPFQLEAVREEGYDEAQGYLFSRPVPAGQVLGVIEALEGRRPPEAGTALPDEGGVAEQ